MPFGGIEQFNSVPGKKNSIDETGRDYFEKDKKPGYRYYYHATFLPLFEKVATSGVFKFKEHVPNLTISPNFSFHFIASEVRKGPEQLLNRMKHLPVDEKERFDRERFNNDEAVMLVIEPDEIYKVYSSSEGAPNIFSTVDQIPDDVDRVIRTRIWDSYQHAMSKEPISKTHTSGIKHPGLRLNKKILSDGTWEKLPEEQRINLPGELPADAIKMAIKRNPEFLGIFTELNNKLSDGGPIDFSLFQEKLSAYLKNGQGIIKDEIPDKKELAANMIMGEIEHFLVSAVRRLYLEVQKYKGKKILKGKDMSELPGPASNREQLLQRIQKLTSIDPGNDVLKRYIASATRAIENEI
ncbi:MAG: hypothetical protein WC453_00715 [Patescibacteria group bacterium]